MRLLALALLALCSALLLRPDAAQAAPSCSGRLLLNVNPTMTYNPYSGTAAAYELDLRVQSSGSGSCAPGLAVFGSAGSDPRELKSGSNSLQYAVLTPSNVAFANSLASPFSVTPVSNTVLLRIRITAGQMVPTGTYSDTLTIRLTNTSGGPSYGEPDISVTLSVSVPALAEINIAGSSGNFGTFSIASLDFGELVQGATRNAFVQVRSTQAVTITVTSTNAGKLAGLGAAAPATLAYSVNLGGTLLSLTTGPDTFDAPAPATTSGSNHALKLTVTGSPDLLPAGDYQDLLTFDIVPR